MFSHTGSHSRYGAQKPRTAVYVLSLLLIFLLPWRNVIVISEGFSIARIMGFFIGICWIGYLLSTYRLRKPTGFHTVAFFFVAWVGISSIWSQDAGFSLYVFATMIAGFGVAFILWDIFYTPQDLKRLSLAYISGCYIVIIVELFDYFSSGVDRLGTVTGGPNYVVARILFAIPLAWFIYISSDGSKQVRYFSTCYILFATLIIFLTKSRQGIVTLTICLFVILSLYLYTIVDTKKLISAISIGTLLLSAVFLGAADTILHNLLAIDRFETAITLLNGGNPDDSLAKRLNILYAGLEVARSNIIIGIGAGGFNSAVKPILGYAGAPHNTYLGILVETGIVGLSLFGLTILSLTRNLLSSFKMVSTAGVLLTAYILLAFLNNWYSGFEPWFVFTMVLLFTKTSKLDL